VPPETSVDFQRTTRHYTPEDITIYIHLSYVSEIGTIDVYIHVFLTLALVGCEWSASRPGRFFLWGVCPSTQFGGGPQRISGRCGEERSCFYQESNPGRAVRSPSLYRLNCP
jgi:hypothetical protein